MSVRIGSLCSGYGGLDLAVMDVLPGAEVAWHAQYDPADKHQWAARILEHRWPGVPNLGDITRADWFEAEPPDILTAGYPCQPISFAGKGLVTDDDRWIWPAVAQCIRLLRPGLVFLENVSAHLVRGAGDVIADLARLGYVGSWLCLRASDVGAPHQRKRLFILARPAEDADRAARGQRRITASGQAQGRGAWANAGGRGRAPAADAGCHARPQDNPNGPASAGSGGGTVPSVARGVAPNTAGDGRDEGRTEPAGILRKSDVAFGGDTAASSPDGSAFVTQRHGDTPQQEADHGRHRLDASGRFLGWGPYGAAIHRWEAVLGRPAPAPTNEHGRLAPPFVEWMMGAPAGWVTDVPAIPRNAQLKALGNGVVVQQGAAAFRVLAGRLDAS